MSSERKYTGIVVSKDIYERLRTQVEKKSSKLRARISISDYVESLIINKIEEEELLSEVGQFLSFAERSGDKIFINDWVRGRIAPVSLKVNPDGSFKLFCEFDNSDSCVHVGYAYSLPELYRMLKEKGIKAQPQTR